MSLSSTTKQLAVVIEVESGITPAGSPLEDPANARSLVIEPSATPDVEKEESNEVTESFTPVRSTLGRKKISFSFGINMKGTKLGTFAAGLPDWFKLLKICMMEVVSGGRIRISGAFSATTPGTTDSPFRHGELITGLTSNATARVVHDVHNGAVDMYVHSLTGTFVAEDILGGSSGAKATISLYVADAHYSAFPASRVLKSMAKLGTGSDIARGTVLKGQTSGAKGIVEVDAVTADLVLKYRPAGGTFVNGEVLDKLGPGSPATGVATVNGDPVFIHGQTASLRLLEDGRSLTGVGMQGNATFELNVSKPIRINFELEGGFSDNEDRPTIQGIDYDYRVAPAWEDAECALAKNEDAVEDAIADELSICVSQASITLGNTLGDRLCANATGGVAGTNVTGRAGSISMNPEATFEAEYGWLTNLFAGSVSRFRTGIGSDLGNSFVMSMPGIQTTAAPNEDNDGTLAIGFQGDLTGGFIWNLNGASPDLSSTGGDNEFVLTYLLA